MTFLLNWIKRLLAWDQHLLMWCDKKYANTRVLIFTWQMGISFINKCANCSWAEIPETSLNCNCSGLMLHCFFQTILFHFGYWTNFSIYGDEIAGKINSRKSTNVKRGRRIKKKKKTNIPKKETRSASLQTRTPKEKNDSIDSYFFVFASAGFDPEDMQVGMRIMHYKTSLLYLWGYWYVVWCVYHPESWHKFMIWLPKPTLKH